MKNLQDIDNFQDDLDAKEYAQVLEEHKQGQMASANYTQSHDNLAENFKPDDDASKQDWQKYYANNSDKAYNPFSKNHDEEEYFGPDPYDYEEDPNDDNGYVEEGGEVEVIGNDTSVCNDFFAEGV